MQEGKPRQHCCDTVKLYINRKKSLPTGILSRIIQAMYHKEVDIQVSAFFNV